MEIIKKLGAALLGAAILVSAAFPLIGCVKNIDDFNYDFTETDNLIEYSFFAHNWNMYEGQDNDRILKAIEQKFNVRIKIQGAPWEGWRDRLSTQIGANEAPDLFFFLPDEKAYSEYVRKQQVQPLDGYIEKADAENLKAMLSSNQFKDATFNGKHYFVPNVYAPSNHVILVRKDWMKQWMDARGYKNKAQPETLSEFADMLKYFTEENPDGTELSTVGMTASQEVGWFDNFLSSFGITPNWTEQGGEYVWNGVTEGYKNMAQYFADLYKKGYIRQEFYTQLDTEKEDDFISGRAGVMITNNNAMIDSVVSRMIKGTLKDKNVDECLDVILPPSSDDKKFEGRYAAYDGYWGGFNISNTAREPMRLVRILDYLMSEEGQMLRLYGIEGVHYELNDKGEVVPNLSERREEGQNRFMTPNPDTLEPAGKYSIGVYFGENRFEIDENNDLHIIRDTTSFLNRALVDKANTFIDEKPLNYRNLRYVIDFDSTFYNNFNKLIDDTEILFIMTVSGQQTYEKAYKDYEGRLVADKYETLKKEINEKAGK